MEIHIGIQNIAREITFETTMAKEDVMERVRQAVENNAVLELTDNKGGTVVVPAGVLGYIQLSDPSSRRVGFIAG